MAPTDQAETNGLTRRDFLRLAGGVVVLFALPTAAQTAAAASSAIASNANAWLAIGADGSVTLFAPAVEFGQSLRASLAQMAAEELTVSPDAIQVVLGDTDRTPAEIPLANGVLATMGIAVRHAAANAREVLARGAAEKWGLPRDQVGLQGGRFFLASDPTTTLGFGELARGQRLVFQSAESAPITPIAQCDVIGQSLPARDGPAYVTGKAVFVADLRPPKMVYARVLRPPCLGAALVKSDARAALAEPGVIALVEQGELVAVVATSPARADRGLRAVQATWREPEHPLPSALYQALRSTAKLEEQVAARGDAEAALAAARHGFSAGYRTAFVAHAPIEPQGAVAVLEADRLVVYANTSQPFKHRNAIAAALGLKPDRVRVIATLIGGAFGGKRGPELSIAAARLARVVGLPVMLTHTHEEEMAWDHFRPAALIDVRCGVGPDGLLQAWDCDLFNCGPRGARFPYSVPNLRLRSHRCTSPLPQGPWRGNGAQANAFAREVHLDHVASELRKDPVAYRLRHLARDSRLARVIQAVVASYGWSPRVSPTGLGVGFACASDGGSFAAEIAEVEVDRASGQIRVRRVVVAQESGLIVNPDGLRNQIEGAVAMGLGPTLREAVRCEEGRFLSRSFASYPIPTFLDTPSIDITLSPNPDLPPQSGSNAALCAIAPAVANAVFDATGQRLRDLPLGRVRVGA